LAGPTTIATSWPSGLFALDEEGIDALGDDSDWLPAENRRLERMAPHQEQR
jgi:hypothetical protein